MKETLLIPLLLFTVVNSFCIISVKHNAPGRGNADVRRGSASRQRLGFARPTKIHSMMINPKDAFEALSNGGHAYIDVRTPEEFQAYRVKGSVNIPCFMPGPGGFGLEEVVDFEEEVYKVFGEAEEAPVFIVGCKIGQRSLAAVGRLRESGYKAVNLQGGIDLWEGMQVPGVEG